MHSWQYCKGKCCTYFDLQTGDCLVDSEGCVFDEEGESIAPGLEYLDAYERKG